MKRIAPIAMSAFFAISTTTGAVAASPEELEAMIVSSSLEDHQNDPDVAVNADRMFVVWSANELPTRQILGRLYDGEEAISDPLPVGTNPNGDSRLDPHVCARDGGGWVVTWGSFPHPDPDGFTAAQIARIGIYAQFLSPDGAPAGDPLQLTNYGWNPGVLGADVSCLPGGGFFAAWLESPYVETEDGPVLLPRVVKGRRFDASGNPVGADIQMNDTWVAEFEPRIVSDSDGRTIVMWGAGCPSYYVDCPVHPDGYDSSLQGRLFAPDGTALGPEFTLTSTVEGNQGDWGFAAAFGLDGEFMIAFSISNPEWEPVRARRFASDGTPLGDDFMVGEPTGDYHIHPVVAHDGAGGFFFMWERTQDDLYGRAFDSNDLPMHPAFLLDDKETGWSRSPQIVRQDTGFHVVWQGIVNGRRTILHQFLTSLPPETTGGGGAGLACPATPEDDCSSPSISRLSVRATDRSSKLRWKWRMTDANGEFAMMTGGMQLCVYESGALLASAGIPSQDDASAGWDSTAATRQTFRQPLDGSFAVGSVKIRYRSGTTHVSLTAGSDDGALVHEEPLVVQLRRSDGSCVGTSGS
jgi:hypothetical protein